MAINHDYNPFDVTCGGGEGVGSSPRPRPPPPRPQNRRHVGVVMGFLYYSRKYDELTQTHIFVPVAVETLGAWCQEGLNWLEEIGRRVSRVTGDLRETFFLFQRLSVAVQKGNAASVRGTLPDQRLD